MFCASFLMKRYVWKSNATIWCLFGLLYNVPIATYTWWKEEEEGGKPIKWWIWGADLLLHENDTVHIVCTYLSCLWWNICEQASNGNSSILFLNSLSKIMPTGPNIPVSNRISLLLYVKNIHHTLWVLLLHSIQYMFV